MIENSLSYNQKNGLKFLAAKKGLIFEYPTDNLSKYVPTGPVWLQPLRWTNQPVGEYKDRFTRYDLLVRGAENT